MKDESPLAKSERRSSIEAAGEDQDRKPHDGNCEESSTTLSIPSTSASPVSETQRRLAQELVALGVPQNRFAFTRVPADYYDKSLEYRRECLRAASLSRLCKTLLLENTKAKKFNEREAVRNATDLTPRQRAALSEHFLVVVQYDNARFDAERLKKELVSRAEGFAPAKAFNLRLAGDGVAEEMTGFVHGAVTPVGARCGLLGSRGQVVLKGAEGEGEEGEGETGAKAKAKAKEVPVVLSSRVARLPEFWMGGGEVDLKLCLSTKEFTRAYDPIVADVMHGDGDDGGQGG